MFNIELCRAQILTEWDFYHESGPQKKERKKENIYEKGVLKC